MCDLNHTDLSYRAVFANPEGFLDSRYSSVLWVGPIDIGFHLIILIAMIIALCCRSAIFMNFHIYLIMTQIAIIVATICEIWNLVDQRSSPELPQAFYSQYSFQIIAQVMEFTTLVLAGSGWAIHTTRFPIFSFVVAFFCGVAYDSIEILPTVIELPESYLVEYLTKLFALLLIAKVTVNELRECERYLLSYVLVVEAVGIDGWTSPVRRRTLMQYIFLCVTSLFIAGKFVYIHVVLYFDMAPIVTSIATKALDALLMLVLTFSYLPMKFPKEDWWRTFNHEKFRNCAMEEFNPDAFPPMTAPIKWEPGVVLPLPPIMAVLEYTQHPQDILDERQERLFDAAEI
jgi:hypothetical protein